MADHVVGDAVVFPGAGFAELALAVARQWQPGDAYAEVEELDIRAPLLLAASPSKIVRVALDGADGRIPAHKIDPVRSVYDMGLDSLMGVKLVVALENRLGLRLPVMALNESPTVDKLALRLVKLLRDDGTQQADEVTTAVAQIAASHAAEVSEASIADFVTDFKKR